MNYPVIKKTKNNVVNKSKKSMIVPSQGAITIPNIFNQTQNNYPFIDDNYDLELDDLEEVVNSLQEFNYYHNTNK